MKIALFLSACVLLLLQGSQGDTAVEAKNTQDALAEISPENKRELEAKNSQEALTEISPDSKRELADAGLQDFVDLHQGLLELKREIDAYQGLDAADRMQTKRGFFKRLGKKIGSVVKKVGKGIWKGVKKVGKAVGKGIKKLGQNIGNALEKFDSTCKSADKICNYVNIK